jgi:hypothetical protein
MKNAILLLLALVSTAAAVPKKLWSWKPSTVTTESVSAINAIIDHKTDALGNTGLIVATATFPNPSENDPPLSKSIQIVWLDWKGNVISEKEIPVDWSLSELFAPPGVAGWRVLSVSRLSMTVGAPGEMLSYRVKGGLVVASSTTHQKEEWESIRYLPANLNSGVWLAVKEPLFYFEGSWADNIAPFEEITAWVER